MTRKRIIGIDPGAGGALAYILPDGRAVTHVTERTLPIEAIRDAICGCDIQDVVAYIEELSGFQRGRFAMRGAQVGVMMRNFGQWEGILAALNIRTILVKPKTWQAGISGVSACKEYKDKKDALKAEAVRRFPLLKPTLKNCDALLIADYGRRVEP
jgi:hypothetical protein